MGTKVRVYYGSQPSGQTLSAVVDRNGWRFEFFKGDSVGMKATSPEGVAHYYTEALYAPEYIQIAFETLAGGTIDQLELWERKAAIRNTDYAKEVI